MISIDKLTVKFGGVTALDAVCVDLHATVCGIIGPNGAGKTTFLNVMSGFNTPVEGSITVFNQPLLKMRPHERARWGLRRSFQQEQVADELTVFENVAVMLDALRIDRADRHTMIDAALEFVHLSDLRNHKTENLSSLERRMTEIARCIVGQPRIVMLDEPGAGFSQTEVERLRDVLVGIYDFSGAMTLLIDHDVDLIRATCVETMVLDFGSLVINGKTEDVLEDERVRRVYLGVEELE